MFQKTRLKLTLVNSIVFILVLGILGSIIYGYVRTHTYHQVDDSLLQSIQETTRPGFRGHLENRNLSLLIWDNKNNLVNYDSLPYPDQLLLNKYSKQFIPNNLNTLDDVKAGQYHFRTITVNALFQGNAVKVEFIRSIDAESAMLKTLLIILLVGCGAGILLSVLAGFLLAERALKPIQKSWNKQQQFVSDASHELRTPLSVIQTRAEILIQDPMATIQDKLPDISVVLKECRRLSRLVGNLLTLARSDSNVIEMDKKEFYLDELLNEIAEHFSEVAMFQNKTISVTSAPPITFYGDKDRIHQLLIILLDNAMKYTGENGEIKLSCYQTKHQIGLIVEDNGIGIKEEDIPKIFDRFYQVSKSRTKNDSLGLGLSIAQWIVEKHSGKFKVDSKTGKGTRFEIQFSKRRQSEPAIWNRRSGSL
jgi:signal transduction histidine kinase